ncbi:LysE family transporter [Acinetobacter pittii]|uniref:LysE family transporter n=1 Tax=Acinetobacter pittii TaxID=48296 RepID=A0A8I1HBU0_ACIPI|nr:LysE family transporter [Acinetobacter pittii]MBF9204996.1 LysE family transporter [Acinetobacter pittii]MBK1445150.1 LysE family transporter [Acinetobacter pittii]MBW8292860.1 LysE family transporter [Acinetobacter pittii]MCF1281405.1 LysE family transporter [Acinetobacter pittii]MCJ9042055.1 LysE family transporter [Acinetobacter pittii]
MVSFMFIGLVVTILLTPGPTNTLLASAGIQAGVKQSLKLIPAEVMGYLIAITSWGVLLESVSHFIPWLPALLKLISATFILYLAFKLWITSTNDIKLDSPLITPKALVVATLLNPKALLFASAIFPHAAWEVLHVYFVHIAIFLSLITPIAFLWIAFGTILISNKLTWLNQRNLQRTAAFILTFFAMPIGYSAISSF